jgi:hypothetical protein
MVLPDGYFETLRLPSPHLAHGLPVCTGIGSQLLLFSSRTAQGIAETTGRSAVGHD